MHYYSNHTAYMQQRLSSVQDLISRKARVLNWKQSAYRFARAVGVLFRGLNFFATLIGFSPIGLLTGGSPRALGYSPQG